MGAGCEVRIRNGPRKFGAPDLAGGPTPKGASLVAFAGGSQAFSGTVPRQGCGAARRALIRRRRLPPARYYSAGGAGFAAGFGGFGGFTGG